MNTLPRAELVLPNFVGLGAQRAGTTWIYECLAAHPDVFVSRKKELYYFTRNYELGREWYAQHFQASDAAIARGEITPDYMYREEALQRIAADLPGAKTFIILRNPADRAISAYALHPERYDGMTFREAAERVPSLLERGFYTRYLTTIHRYIPPERVLVLFYDDVASRPAQLLDQLFGYLGVRTGVRPPCMSKRVNRVIYPRIQRALQAAGLGWSIEAVKKTPVGRWVRNFHSNPRRETSVVTEGDIAWMRRLFHDEIEALSRLTGRDLSAWQQ